MSTDRKRNKHTTVLQERDSFFTSDRTGSKNVDSSIFNDMKFSELRSEREVSKKDKSWDLLTENQKQNMLHDFNALEPLMEKRNTKGNDYLKFNPDRKQFNYIGEEMNSGGEEEERERNSSEEDDQYLFLSKIPNSHTHMYVIPPINLFLEKSKKKKNTELNRQYCLLKDEYIYELNKLNCFMEFENYILPLISKNILVKELKINDLLLNINKIDQELEFSYIHMNLNNSNKWNFCYKLDNGEKEIFYLCMVFKLNEERSYSTKLKFIKSNILGIVNSNNREDDGNDLVHLNDKLIKEEQLKEYNTEIENLNGKFEGFFYFTCNCIFNS